MLNTVKQYIKDNNLIEYSDNITIGVSGGADSVCLLLILNELKKEYNLSLKVVHVNHMVREDAKDDATFVENLCKKLDIPFFLKTFNVELYAKENKCSTEEAGRILRYKTFEEIAGTGKIAVAHNKNDNVETVLLNLTRGCALNGITGIKNKRQNIIRPIMCLERKKIEQYLKEQNQEYKTDYTNLENVYNRNKIRNCVIPELEKINSSVVNNVSKTIEKFNELSDFVNLFVNDFVNNNVKTLNDKTFININEFLKQKEIIQKEVIFKILSKYTSKNINTKHIDDVLKLSKTDGKMLNLPEKIVVYNEFGNLKILKECNLDEEILEMGLNHTDFGEFYLRIYENDNNVSYHDRYKTVNYDLVDELSVGYIKKDADILLNNRQVKLKDYFNDEKINGLTPVIYNKNDVVWVVGHRINEKYKINEDCKQIVSLKSL